MHAWHACTWISIASHGDCHAWSMAAVDHTGMDGSALLQGSRAAPSPGGFTVGRAQASSGAAGPPAPVFRSPAGVSESGLVNSVIDFGIAVPAPAATSTQSTQPSRPPDVEAGRPTAEMQELHLQVQELQAAGQAQQGLPAPAPVQDDGHRNHRLGTAVMRIALIAPTVLNWLALVYAHWWAVAEVVDSAGIVRTVARSRNYNYRYMFLSTFHASVATVFAHLWLTLGFVARAHRLADAGVVGGRSYTERQAAAAAEAGRLTAAEWAHLGVVAFECAFANGLVFTMASGVYHGHSGYEFRCWKAPDDGYCVYHTLRNAILPGFYITAGVRLVGAPVRAAVVQAQGSATAAFAAGALRGTLQVLAVVAVVLAREAAFLLGYPTELFSGDCDFEKNMDPTTNTKWLYSAPVHACAPDLFIDGGNATAGGYASAAAWAYQHSNATVLQHYYPLYYQYSGSDVVIIYFTIGSVLYFASRGQDLLHDRVLTELEMRPRHVVVLLFWLAATASVLAGAAAALAEWGDTSKEKLLSDGAASSSQVFLFGIAAVLWSDAIVAAARSALTMGGTSEPGAGAAAGDGSRVIFGSMRFPPPPEALRLKEALYRHGVELVIVDMTAGGDIDTSVFESIERADTFLIFGTSHYGEDTGNPASTFFESKYALDRNKRIILIRMIPFGRDFDHLQARVLFGQNRLELLWEAGAPQMPATLVDDIVRAIDQ
eukprot:SAG22_NODE_2357_length_2669_cov_2.804280_1_plen_715_part_00